MTLVFNDHEIKIYPDCIRIYNGNGTLDDIVFITKDEYKFYKLHLKSNSFRNAFGIKDVE